MDNTCTNASSDEGLDIDGDLFFDPLNNSLNESDDKSRVEVQHNALNSGVWDNDWVSFDELQLEWNDITTPSTSRRI